MQVLEQRLVARGTEKPESLQTRLKNAPGELALILSGKETFKYRIVNDDIEVSKTTINRLINALYQRELVVKKVEKKWNPLYSAVGIVVGLVLAHEIVRNRKSWM